MFKKYSSLILTGSWLLMTVSLAAWWLIFGLMQARRLAATNYQFPEEIVRGQRMLYWEGGSLILLLLCGGLALFYLSLREVNRNRQMKEFFATLTHELKTPLASLRVQVESLQEDLSGTDHSRLIDRLVNDSVRLELQLENALFLAGAGDSKQLHLENLRLKSLLGALKSHWPEIEGEIPDECVVRADPRALEGVLKNLIQNARVHGGATKIHISARDENSLVRLAVEDNGRGFKGDFKKLGVLFARHTSVSGSGVGLYLARQLTRMMNGRLEFDMSSKGGGFTAFVILEKGA